MKTIRSFTVAALLAIGASAEQVFADKPKADGKCYALAFSSGDEDAIYQVGALAGLVNSTTAGEHGYDAVSGVSGGAINAVMLSSFAKGDESSAVERMLQFWKNAANTDLYKNWFGGVVRGLFFEGGVYNSAPLEDFLKKEFANVTIQR